MGRVKEAMFDQEAVAFMSVLRERDGYRDIAFQMQSALNAILALDPEDTDSGFNEWGEAECFRKARRIAKDTLKELNKEYGNGRNGIGEAIQRVAANHQGQSW